MSQAPNIDGVIIQWGDRLFYPGNRIVRGRALPNLRGLSTSERAATIRARIEATVVRRAPQVMIKVTGGGRGMTAIAAHFRYISKNGRLDIEDERGEKIRGKDVLRELVEDWRFGGTLIDEVSPRREAFNIMLSMPRGTDPLAVLQAAREFARVELNDHKFVMVLHDHQANPHVHISARAESRHGKRLNPRKADLQRWREIFAEKLRERGIDAEATRQATRRRNRSYEALWRIKAREDGRLRSDGSASRTKSSDRAQATRAEAVEAWEQVARALAASGVKADRDLAQSITKFFKDMPAVKMLDRTVRTTEIAPPSKSLDVDQRR
jgi:hypothetical protein